MTNDTYKNHNLYEKKVHLKLNKKFNREFKIEMLYQSVGNQNK